MSAPALPNMSTAITHNVIVGFVPLLTILIRLAAPNTIHIVPKMKNNTCAALTDDGV
jgi:hypothetical protein